jgi:hypothetical protein
MIPNVYMLSHDYRPGERINTKKLIGIYASRSDAEAAAMRIASKPGFRAYPDDFVIDDYIVDEDRISQGFTYK